VAALLLLAIAAVIAFQLLRSVPAIAARPNVPAAITTASAAPSLPWPARGAGAVGATDVGLLATGGSTTPQPMFSVAKIMTALVILEDKPLKTGESGPTLTVDAADVEIYKARLAGGESVVKVQAGEQLTELQALQALLIPSGNNVGVLLAKWDAGSEAALVVKMNAKARALHLVNTTFDDVSGVSTKTQGVPSELVVLAGLAIKDPVITSIVAMKQAELPVAGVVYNVDYALGQENIIGVKTGSSPEGGANFVFAASHAIEGRPITILGAVMGLTTLDEAFAASKELIKAVRTNLSIRHLVLAGSALGTYRTPWGAGTDIVPVKALDVVNWPGLPVRAHFEARPVNAPLGAGTTVGSFSIRAGDQVLQTPLVTRTDLGKVPTRYRLTRLDL
jgi:D-alanyl-D-alanine carboxypeptidase (penicillin-binding protein 5/6)